MAKSSGLSCSINFWCMYVSFTADYLFCEVWDWTSSKLENRRKEWENLSELVQETSRKVVNQANGGFLFFSDAYWCSMSIVLRRRNESCNTFFVTLSVRYLYNSLPMSMEINLQFLTQSEIKPKPKSFPARRVGYIDVLYIQTPLTANQGTN